ncbi:hypothetical protein BGZ98_008894 [Dissophora globulifera]|nr:hypothetical protein BGZ98_008894 [Dissophora globulifera]
MHARHEHSHHVSAASNGSTSGAVETEDYLNFHDYIHAKHDDDKDGDDSRSSLSFPPPDRLSTHDESSHETTHESTHHHQYPPLDLVPPPTQDLFRTLMEELQTQAAIQRDQFMASSTRPESTSEVSDYSFNSQHSKPLPRFMMVPLDFLSPDYDSCLHHESDPHNRSTTDSTAHSYSETFGNVNQSHSCSSAGPSSSIPAHSSLATMSSDVPTGGMDSSGSGVFSTSKKRQITVDSHAYEDNQNGNTTPPQFPSTQEQLSPPTQDLFRMLMDELQTQAALQRDQVLATTARQDALPAGMNPNATDFAFSSQGNGNHSQHHHHHTRLPRFVMESFDFLSPDYDCMQVDGTGAQSNTSQGVFLNTGVSSDSQDTTATSTVRSNGQTTTTPPPHPSHEEHLSPPTQDLFRTLMEELETQVAFQRDQFLAETTGVAPRVDPEEYVFNGQHLRPLPRFMFEPLDFLSAGYESCLDGTMQHQDSLSHHFGTTSHSLMDIDMGRSMTSTTLSGKTLQDGSRHARRRSQQNKYKTILPQRPKASTIAPSRGSGKEGSTQSAVNPLKKRRLGDDAESVSSSSPSPPSTFLTFNPTSPAGLDADEPKDSEISPAVMSALSISSSGEVGSPDDSNEGSGGAAVKRPWTPKDESLLLKLFAKRMPIKEIAKTLDRTVHSVRSRRQILTDPGFVKGKGHGVSRRCKLDPATTTKLPTYAQMAFLSLAWLPDLEGTLNDVATMVEKLFSRHLNRIPRTGHKNLQIWRAQISDALAHEKGQPRPRFESFGLKRGRQWVYRLTEFGKGVVEAMGGVDQVCQDLLKSNEMELAASAGDDSNDLAGAINRDADGLLGGGSGADAGIGQGQGYGYSYKPPDTRQKAGKRSRASRKAAAAAKKKQEEVGKGLTASPGEGAANAIAYAMEAMAAGLARMMALEEERGASDERSSASQNEEQ